MAHSRPFHTECNEAFCKSRATETVYNSYNADLGNFCKRHAAKRVKELNEGEKALHARPVKEFLK